jgi:hypothetical protein
MKALAVIGLLLASCASTSVADVLMPDELTLGHAEGTSATVGGYSGHNDMFEYEGESSVIAAALTWHIPSIDPHPVVDRNEILSTSVIVDEEITTDGIEFSESMATGATFKADWRHAAVFGVVIAILLIGLLVKLQRSNGWH